MSIQSVASIGFRRLLVANQQLAALVASTNGNYKIIRGPSAGSFPPPYIMMTKLYGGEENLNPSRSFDMIWRIEAVSDDQVLAETLSSLIETALVGQWPELIEGWEPWAAITQGVPFHDTVLVQSRPYTQEGAQYRIRAVKDKN